MGRNNRRVCLSLWCLAQKGQARKQNKAKKITQKKKTPARQAVRRGSSRELVEQLGVLVANLTRDLPLRRTGRRGGCGRRRRRWRRDDDGRTGARGRGGLHLHPLAPVRAVAEILDVLVESRRLRTIVRRTELTTAEDARAFLDAVTLGHLLLQQLLRCLIRRAVRCLRDGVHRLGALRIRLHATEHALGVRESGLHDLRPDALHHRDPDERDHEKRSADVPTNLALEPLRRDDVRESHRSDSRDRRHERVAPDRHDHRVDERDRDPRSKSGDPSREAVSPAPEIARERDVRCRNDARCNLEHLAVGPDAEVEHEHQERDEHASDAQDPLPDDLGGAALLADEADRDA